MSYCAVGCLQFLVLLCWCCVCTVFVCFSWLLRCLDWLVFSRWKEFHHRLFSYCVLKVPFLWVLYPKAWECNLVIILSCSASASMMAVALVCSQRWSLVAAMTLFLPQFLTCAAHASVISDFCALRIFSHSVPKMGSDYGVFCQAAGNERWLYWFGQCSP